MSRKRPSGSPQAQNERRKAYKATQKQVSNPGQPSTCNRKARRFDKFMEATERRLAEERSDES